MSYLLFVDESGSDHGDSPFEVLAGVAIHDRKLWDLVRKVQKAELDCFGQRYSPGEREAKAKSLLKAKTFRLADQMPAIEANERRREDRAVKSIAVIKDLRPLEQREGVEAWVAHKTKKGKAGFPAKPPPPG
jgi:hypothetical protein